MRDRCATARDWLTRLGALPSEGPAEDASPYAAHLAACPDCLALVRRLRAFEDACPTVLEHETAAEAEGAFLAAARAQHEATTPSARTARSWRPLAATAAVLAVAVGVWWLSESAPAHRRAPTNEEASLTIRMRSGEVWIDGAPLGALTDEVPRYGSVLTTGPASSLEIGDPADARVALAPRSELEVVSWSPEGTRLVLRHGTVRAFVARRTPGVRFEVHTEDARVVVHGTEFIVRYDAATGTIIDGLSGTVQVLGRDGTPIGVVHAETSLRTGPPPSKPPVAAAEHRRDPFEEPGNARANDDPTSKDQALHQAFALLLAPAPAPPDNPAPDVPVPPLPLARFQSPTPHSESDDLEETVLEASLAAVEAETAAPERALPSLGDIRALVAAGDTNRAIAQLEDMKPGDWRRDALLADALRIEGRWREAAEACVDALARAPAPLPPLLADLATLQGDRLDLPNAAAETWECYLAAAPDGPEAETAIARLIRIHVLAGEREEALRWLTIYHQRFDQGRQRAEVERLERLLEK